MRALFLAAALLGGAAAAVPAAPAAAPAAGPLVVTTGPAEVRHQLVPGATLVWPIQVTANVDELDSLTGALELSGGLARSDDITAEVLSCPEDWPGGSCPRDEYTVFAQTPLDRFPPARAPLQDGPRPRPGTTYVQVRIRVASDARIPEDATMTSVLQVEAAGPGGAVSASSDPAISISSLADTGGGVQGSVGVALAAVVAGLLLAGLARMRGRGRDSHA